MKLDVSDLFPKLPKKKTGRYKATCVRPIKGYDFNPLKGYPPNKGCFCGSGAKAKRCCLRILATCVPKETADHVRGQWDDILKGFVTFPKPTVESWNE